MVNSIFRWSGFVLIAGAVLMGTGFAMLPFIPKGPLTLPISVLLLISSVLLLLSLPGMYARQADAAGRLGLVGYALLEIGMLLLVVALSPGVRFSAYNPPSSPGGSVVDGLLALALVLGLVATAIVTIRAGVFPRWAGFLLLAGTAGFFFAFFDDILPGIGGAAGILLLAVPAGFLWIGIAMLREKRGENRAAHVRPVAQRAGQS